MDALHYASVCSPTSPKFFLVQSDSKETNLLQDLETTSPLASLVQFGGIMIEVAFILYVFLTFSTTNGFDPNIFAIPSVPCVSLGRSEKKIFVSGFRMYTISCVFCQFGSTVFSMP